MKRVVFTITFLLSLTIFVPFALAQSNPCTHNNSYTQTCTTNYNQCIQSGAAVSDCSQWASQYDTSMAAYDACSANPNNNDVSNCLTDLNAGTNAQTQIESITQTAAGQTISQTVGNPNQPQSVNISQQQIDQQISNQVGTPSAPPSVTTNQSVSAPQTTSNSSNITYTPLEPLPGFTNPTQGDITQYVPAVFRILLVLGGIMAVLLIVLAGITYMLSEVTDKKAEARRRINNALFGLLLLIGAWLILNTINPQLVSFKAFFNPAGGLPGGTSPNISGTGGTAPGTGPGSAQDQQCQSGSTSGLQCYLTQQPNNSYTCTCTAY